MAPLELSPAAARAGIIATNPHLLRMQQTANNRSRE
jgi:hypothetical protein